MPQHAAIYGRNELASLLERVRPLVTDGETRLESFPDGEHVVIQWPDVKIVIRQTPRGKVKAQLQSFATHVQSRCTSDPALVKRIGRMVEVLAMTFEPGLDTGGRCAALLGRLADRMGGVYAVDDVVFAPTGQRIAVPTASAPKPATSVPKLVLPKDAKDAKGGGAGAGGAPVASPSKGVAPPAPAANASAPRALDEDDDDHEDDDLHPPPAERVVRRAYCLCAVALRGFLEDSQERESAKLEVEAARQWLRAGGMESELEPHERELLATPIGGAPRQWVTNATWRSEGIAVLAWALKASELPAHDVQVDPMRLAAELGFRAESPALLRAPVLRSGSELDAMERRLLGIHWRFREYALRPRPVDFLAFAKTAWFGGFDARGVPTAEGDLAIDGVPITRAERIRVRDCQSVALERHHAINWLIGQNPVYAEVDTST